MHTGIGLNVTRRLLAGSSGAAALLVGETQGLAFDFTDQSALIIDTGTPANNYDSTGIVSSGSLVGPSGKLTYTSPSNKMTMQSDGYYRYQAHNLCLQSEDFTTSWPNTGSTDVANATTAPDGTTTADQIIETAVTSGHGVQQAITLVVGASYRIAVRVKKGPTARSHFAIGTVNAGTGYSYFNLDTVAVGTKLGSHIASGITSLGDGWNLCYIDIVPTSASVTVFLIPASSDSVPSYAGDVAYSFYLWGAHVYRTPANTDYIKTTDAAKYALPIEYDTSGNCLGLLVEEQRTNLCLYSNDLTQAGSWTASNMTTAKTATGPDNVANSATTITATAGNATILQAITSTSAARVTSVFIKRRAGTGNIDLTQDNGATWTTQAVDSTWTRFSLSSVTSANPTVGIRIVTSGDAVDVALFSHEVGSFVTSPIISYGAATTRAADQKSQLTSTLPLSATAGSLYAYVVPYAGSDLAGIVSLNDASGDEEIVIYKDASANIVAQVEDGGVGQLAPLDSTVNASSNTAFKVALAWAANDFALSADGTAAQTDTGGTLPTVTTLEIGADQANNYFNGIIKAIAYWPRRRANSELVTVTT